jgi:arylsulfatase A-like enzyme
LGELFSYLDRTVGGENYVIALTSDHGALPLPEELKRRGIDASRIHPDTVKADMMAVGEEIKNRMGLLVNPIISAGGEIMVNDLYMQSMTGGQVVAELMLELQKLPYIADVYPRFELSSNTSQSVSPYWRKFRNCYHPDRGPDLFVRFKENYIFSYDSTGTTHGSTYDYDCIVPVIFAGPGVAIGRDKAPIRTIDIAPTLAALMRIPINGKMDGEIVKVALDR